MKLQRHERDDFLKLFMEFNYQLQDVNGHEALIASGVPAERVVELEEILSTMVEDMQYHYGTLSIPPRKE